MKVGENSVVLHTPKGNDVVTFSIKKGVNEEVFGYGIETFERMYNDAVGPEGMTVEALKEFSGGKPIGAIRASFGYANIMSDIERFVAVVLEFLKT